MSDRDSHTVKGVFLRIRKGKPELLLLEHKAREKTAKQKSGKVFKEKPRLGLPGGKVEDLETFKDAMIREYKEELDFDLPEDILKERLCFHSAIKPSQRVDSDSHQEHYFFAELPSDLEIGEIEDNEEIVRGQFFPLDKLPLPNDPLPFTGGQLQGLVNLLRLLRYQIEDADLWLSTVEKRAYDFIDGRRG